MSEAEELTQEWNRGAFRRWYAEHRGFRGFTGDVMPADECEIENAMSVECVSGVTNAVAVGWYLNLREVEKSPMMETVDGIFRDRATELARRMRSLNAEEIDEMFECANKCGMTISIGG